MTAIFLFGTLCHAPLFEVVAGLPLGGRSAQLPGERVARAAGGPYPVLTEGPMADGLLVEVDDRTMARLDFYESCFGYRRVPVDLLVGGTPVAAQVWRPRGIETAEDADWCLDDWARDWGAISVEAAREVMRQQTTASPEEIAQRFWMIRARAQSHLRAGQWNRPRRVGRGMTRADVDIETIRHPYTGFFTVEETRARFRRFNGGWSDPVERGSFRVADAATVLPYDPLRDRVLFVEQARFGPLSHGDAAPWLLEPVAGMVDAGETPEAAARREAEEEAGLTIGALHKVASYYPSPGGIAQVLHSFVGIADLPDGVTGTHGSDAEDEDILTHIVSFDTARALLETGDLVDAPSIISLQWLMQHRDRLRAEP